MQQNKTKKMVGISLFGALAFVLMFIAFPVIPAFSYLKIDFSDLPILLSFFLYGPAGGIISALIRSILHYLQTGGDMGYPIGDAAGFLATLAYTLPVYYLLQKSKTKAGVILSLLAGTIVLTVVLSVANWYVFTPLYMNLLNFQMGPIKELVLAGILPFNIIKGLVISAVILLVMPKLKPWLTHQNIKLTYK
ncbi:ecf transporter substrate-specific component [Trichococcus palustris]|jgi:riboflavin transporter|uniref:Riboflavin transporter n=1 Tax=Trichococcus palustris TaxID=140314 RepID=A0A143Y8G4_9LACT|nr:ECF transporter S component [Trichococcus palustris]CZQ83529.1 ecf transporter substrate-specific component [Trichococcus palustris]SFK70030.1 Riboflavin transporter FmnP [Trichococcus palustris]